MKIGHSYITPTSASADSEAVDKGADNVLDPSVNVVWSPSAAGAQAVVLNLGSSVTIRAVLIQHTNANAPEIRFEEENPPITLIATPTLQQDKNQRYKASWNDVDAAEGQFLSVTVDNADTVDGEDAFIGAIHVWAELLEIENPEWGLQKIGRRGRRVRDFPNGAFVNYKIGNARTEMLGSFETDAQDTPEQALWHGEDEPIMIDFDLTDQLWEVWPMQSMMEEIGRTRQNFGQDFVSFILREIA